MQEVQGQTTTRIDSVPRMSHKSDHMLNEALLVLAGGLAACNEARVGLIAWGGGTGLVGGQLQPSGPAPLILALDRMTATRGLYPTESVLTVEAGTILANAQQRATDAGFLFPLSLASEGSARIGGLCDQPPGGGQVALDIRRRDHLQGSDLHGRTR